MFRAVLREVSLSNFDQKNQLKAEVCSLPCEEDVSIPYCLFTGDLRRIEDQASYLVIQHFNQCWITPGRDGCQRFKQNKGLSCDEKSPPDV